ncbi:MAG: hypothetical protein Tsb0013_09580 [Phycisphaerales bacterium]
MTDPVCACSFTLDTHDPDAMTRFYTERLGFVHVSTEQSGLMYERQRVRHPSGDLELVFRSCLPRPHVGSAPGTLMEITMRVADPDRAIEGWPVEERHPEEGPAERIVLRDPSNYTLVLRRDGV